MTTNQKLKLCWNCEGSVSRESDNCPYCGVYLRRDEDDDLHFEEEWQEEETFTPPYQVEEEQAEEEEIPNPPFAEEVAKEEIPSKLAPKSISTPAPEESWKVVVLPLGLLLAGSILFLFSILLLLFSQNGTLVLKWDGSYWIAYLALALPFLFIGWKMAERLQEGDEKQTVSEPTNRS